MKFTIAVLSNSIAQNFIAWSTPLQHCETIEEARSIAKGIWAKMHEELQEKNEMIIIHDGKECF